MIDSSSSPVVATPSLTMCRISRQSASCSRSVRCPGTSRRTGSACMPMYLKNLAAASIVDGRRFGSADEFDERQQIDGIERMGDEEALWRDHVALQIRRRQPGGARGNDDIRARMAAHLRQHALLELQLLGNVLLNEIRALGHDPKVGRERQLALRRQRRRGQARQRGFRIVDRAAYPRFHFRLDVGGDHIDAEMQRPRGPSAADDAGTQQPECLHCPHA